MDIKQTCMTFAIAVALTACGGDDKTETAAPDQSVKISIPTLAPGVHRVVLGGEEQPIVGQYYIGNNADKILILNDDEQHATKVYYTDAKQKWQSLPATQKSEQLKFLNNEQLEPYPLQQNMLVGQYRLSLDEQQTVKLNIDAAGKMTTSGTGCNLVGQLEKSNIPNVMPYALTAKNCSNLPSKLNGYLVQDDEYAPAAFRMVNLNESLKDLWLYAE